MQKTPLFDKHVQLGARMVPFSGWEMPVQYTGIIDEHLHTREKVSIFDISHMGEFVLEGETALADIEKLVTCNITSLGHGKARYGFMLNENAGIIDDLIVFKYSEEKFMIVVNAGTIAKDADWIKKHISPKTTFTDISGEMAKIDVQGPLATLTVAEVFGKFFDTTLQKRFNFTEIGFTDGNVIISSTGYTGEDGYEIFCKNSLVGMLFDKFLENENMKPVGLGARDSLRLEKGFSLYGHDINDNTTPFEANLMRFVDMDKEFIGKEVLLAKTQSVEDVMFLTGFICSGRRAAREGFKIVSGGKEIGHVTSGVFSPCLKQAIGLCYIAKEFSEKGTKIELTDGRVEIKATVKAPPFV